MITIDKINIYKKYNGDIDAWIRLNSNLERSIKENDWYEIDHLIQSLTLLKKGENMFDPSKLSSIMKSKGFTNKKIAEAVNNYGVSIKEDSFKAYRQGRANPRMEVFEAIVEVLGITEQDLFTDADSKRSAIAKYEIQKNRDTYAPLFPELQNNFDTISMPIIHAGAGAEALLHEHELEHINIEKKLIPANRISALENKNTVAIRIVGDSMEPKINENDVLFIDMLNGRSFLQKDGIYLIRYGDAIQIKHVQFLENDHANLISTNTIYPVISTQKEGIDWEILGKPFMRWGVEYFSEIEIK